MDYQKAYYKLFNAITDILNVLQKTQQEMEEMYINSDEPKLYMFPKKSNHLENSN